MGDRPGRSLSYLLRARSPPGVGRPTASTRPQRETQDWLADNAAHIFPGLDDGDGGYRREGEWERYVRINDDPIDLYVDSPAGSRSTSKDCDPIASGFPNLLPGGRLDAQQLRLRCGGDGGAFGQALRQGDLQVSPSQPRSRMVRAILPDVLETSGSSPNGRRGRFWTRSWSGLDVEELLPNRGKGHAALRPGGRRVGGSGPADPGRRAHRHRPWRAKANRACRFADALGDGAVYLRRAGVRRPAARCATLQQFQEELKYRPPEAHRPRRLRTAWSAWRRADDLRPAAPMLEHSEVLLGPAVVRLHAGLASRPRAKRPAAEQPGGRPDLTSREGEITDITFVYLRLCRYGEAWAGLDPRRGSTTSWA